MRLKAKNMEVLSSLSGMKVLFEIDKTSYENVKELQNKKIDYELSVDVDRWRNKRTNDHNALFWDMVGLLHKKVNDPTLSKEEIYRTLIREYGVSTVLPIPTEILDMVISAHEQKGSGWQTEVQRKSNLNGDYTNVKFYYGSSVYNSKQMYTLVEGLKMECEQQGLDLSMYDKEMTSLLEKMEKKENGKSDTNK